MGEERKLRKIFEFFMTSIISWNALTMFCAILKDTGDGTGDDHCQGCGLTRCPKSSAHTELCRGDGWDGHGSFRDAGSSPTYMFLAPKQRHVGQHEHVKAMRYAACRAGTGAAWNVQK